MRKVKHKTSLKDLIDSIQWQAIEVYQKGLQRLAPDKITVGFFQGKKTDPKINEVRVRLGREVMNSLKWEAGDKIMPLYDPDDQMNFLMVKSDSGVGYTLGSESNSTSCRISFKWNRDIPLRRMAPKAVEFECYKKQLIFRVTSTEESEDE